MTGPREGRLSDYRDVERETLEREAEEIDERCDREQDAQYDED